MIGRTLIGALALVAAVGLGAMSIPGAGAHSRQDGVKVGLLKCNVGGGWGFVFGASKDVKCVFTPEGGKPSERYTGSIDKYGVDIGYTEAGVIPWAVLVPSSDVSPGALTGTYGAATARATAGIGLGANVLVGGGDNSISPRPVGISGQKGLNVAGGIGAVSLEAVK